MELEIRNADVIPSDVPATPEDLDALEAFARSFDGYAHWGDRCGPLAEAVAAEFRASGTLTGELSDLRACLFYEQQRWRWRDALPDDDARAYLQALLDAIRAGARPATGAGAADEA